MYEYYCLNPISAVGLDKFPAKYENTECMQEADAILVRSADMHNLEVAEKTAAVARAGAGVNNIPLEKMTKKGVVVFNTPGANANGVKEMVIAGMLLASRDIIGGIEWLEKQDVTEDIAKRAEKQKKQFAGCEISGKKLGIIGLGAIGVRVANAAIHLGMEVYGYDPYISVDAAWNLSRSISHINDINMIYRDCDYITIHVPLTDATKKMIGKEEIAQMKDDVVLLNFARDLLVEDIELNVIVARSVLEKLGNSVDVAMTGKAALEMFKPGEYDLVLLDIQLPDMTGLDISRELTKRYPREDLPPLVALTANVLKDKQEYLNAGMDDVLSKPLSVPALTAMIKKFWDTQDDEESTVTTEENSKSEALLDIPMLEQYLELVGPKLITDGLAVFEKMMPGYVSVLESNLTAQDKKGIVEEGHKIKGAAGSVGLRHLQQLGQQIQSPDLPAWEDNVGEWIEEMKEEWRHDVEVLKAWVAKATKK